MRMLGMDVMVEGLRERTLATGMLVSFLAIVINLPPRDVDDVINLLLWTLLAALNVLCVMAEVRHDNERAAAVRADAGNAGTASDGVVDRAD